MPRLFQNMTIRRESCCGRLGGHHQNTQGLQFLGNKYFVGELGEINKMPQGMVEILWSPGGAMRKIIIEPR